MEQATPLLEPKYWFLRLQSHETLGALALSQTFRKFRFGSKSKTFRRFVPLENSRKKSKIEKGRPVFPAGISERNFVFHLHVSHQSADAVAIVTNRVLVSRRVTLSAPYRGCDQLEQLFTYRKIHFCSHRTVHRDFRIFFKSKSIVSRITPLMVENRQ